MDEKKKTPPSPRVMNNSKKFATHRCSKDEQKKERGEINLLTRFILPELYLKGCESREVCLIKMKGGGGGGADCGR